MKVNLKSFPKQLIKIIITIAILIIIVIYYKPKTIYNKLIKHKEPVTIDIIRTEKLQNKYIIVGKYKNNYYVSISNIKITNKKIPMLVLSNDILKYKKETFLRFNYVFPHETNKKQITKLFEGDL